MKRLRNGMQCGLMLLGLVFCVATSNPEPPTRIVTNSTWIVENLYSGQTNVPLDIVIKLTIGTRDFDSGEGAPPLYQIKNGMEKIEIRRRSTNELVPYTLEISESSTLLTPKEPFSANTDYILITSEISRYLETERVWPGNIFFTTRSAPAVTGIWQNGNTLIISFSEEMDPESLRIHQQSVDILFEEDGEILSLAARFNLADFSYETKGSLFMMAPVDGLPLSMDSKLFISNRVRAKSGATLDGNGNGLSEGAQGVTPDDYFAAFTRYTEFPQCYTRPDLPKPCNKREDIPEL